MRRICLLAPLLSSTLTASGLTISNHADRLSGGRRDFVAIVAASLAPASLPVWADVADGNALPEGAQKFSRLIRVKSDLKNVEKRVKNAASEIDDKEWENIGQFLRQIYQTGEDMKSMSGGIFDPEKKKQALVAAESLKKFAKSADVPVNKRDGDGFLAVAHNMDATFEDFLDQLRDVPDEL